MPTADIHKSKSARIAFFLCLFLGMFGIHRFYVGKIGTGILMLLTLGGLGIWLLIDLGNLVCNNFQDSNNNTLELTQNPSMMKKIIMTLSAVIMGFIIFFISLSLLLFSFMSTEAPVVRDQLYALKSGNIEMAYSYTSRDFQQATSLEEYKNFVHQHPILENYRNANISSLKIVNDKGTAIYTLQTVDSNTPVEYKLIKEDGIWKILAMEVGATVAANNAVFTVETSVQVNDQSTGKQ